MKVVCCVCFRSMGSSSSKHKQLLNGQPSNKEMQELSATYKIPLAHLNLLKQKYAMYKNKNNRINIFNYLVLYREFVNASAPDMDIYKSFNAFDKNRDGFLDFLVRASMFVSFLDGFDNQCFFCWCLLKEMIRAITGQTPPGFGQTVGQVENKKVIAEKPVQKNLKQNQIVYNPPVQQIQQQYQQLQPTIVEDYVLHHNNIQEQPTVIEDYVYPLPRQTVYQGPSLPVLQHETVLTPHILSNSIERINYRPNRDDLLQLALPRDRIIKPQILPSSSERIFHRRRSKSPVIMRQHSSRTRYSPANRQYSTRRRYSPARRLSPVRHSSFVRRYSPSETSGSLSRIQSPVRRHHTTVAVRTSSPPRYSKIVDSLPSTVVRRSSTFRSENTLHDNSETDVQTSYEPTNDHASNTRRRKIRKITIYVPKQRPYSPTIHRRLARRRLHRDYAYDEPDRYSDN